MLVIADGATSRLATQMGYCTEAPKGVCSRAFIEGGTHNVDFDGARRALDPDRHSTTTRADRSVGLTAACEADRDWPS